MKRMLKIFQEVLNFILPPRCLKCGAVIGGTENGLCPDCFNEITFISEPYCKRCGRPFNGEGTQGMVCGDCMKKHKNPFRYSRSAFVYDEYSKTLILSFKFHDKTENAVFLGKLLYKSGKDIFSSGADVLMPIPLHYSRLLKRKYNQSSLLAKEVSKMCGLPIDNTSVIRHKRTRPQVEFSGQARIKNVKGAFQVKNPLNVKGKRIVLIDDVMTTGSTLRECALVLLAAGAASVDTLTVARVL